MRGDVIDIGGKKENKRGAFRPPKDVSSWEYLNIDASVNPDYCCSAEDIPVKDCHFDSALMCEVIEHLENPEGVIRESFRILKKGGVLILTAPFLYPYHADPYDFQRITDVKLRAMLNKAGFSEIEIRSMGGTGSVIHDILYVSFSKVKRGSLLLKALKISKPLFLFMDRVLNKSERFITTGYFVVAKK